MKIYAVYIKDIRYPELRHNLHSQHTTLEKAEESAKAYSRYHNCTDPECKPWIQEQCVQED